MNFRAVLVLLKMAGSAQAHKSMSFIWILWRTLYVYLCPAAWLKIYWAKPISNRKWQNRLNSWFESSILNGFLACNSIKHDALTLMLKGLFVCRINRLFLSLIDVRIVLLTLLSSSKTICSLIGRVDAVGNCKFKDFYNN